MQDEQLIQDILESVIKAVDIPVTLKMRTGWDVSHKNAQTIAQIAQKSGIQMLSIHGRTKEDKYKVEAEYHTIKDVVRQVNIPVIANGDVASADKAKKILEYTGASGVMVGRATQGSPWLIHEIDHFLKTGQHAQNHPA